jgi:hypothetical protein
MNSQQCHPHANVLDTILQEAHAAIQQTRRFLAVFDLDSTLFDLTLRVSAIFDDFINDTTNRNLFPNECEKLKSAQILRTDWGINEALIRIGMTSQTNPEFCHALMEFWSYHFFSDTHLHRDEPLPGAVEFVQELRTTGAHVMYLTGRDIPRMLKGTEQSLKSWNFPLGGEGAKLVLKPAAGLDDASFKVTVLKEARKKYDRIWLFENEPVNLNLTAKHCPDIGLVFIDSAHSGRESVAPDLARIQHFETDLEAFRHFRGK